nr:PREDICTED: nose resistant to fluoxetine protein 6-like [Tribolium castaneum]XP_015835054.1 PREDICTED: nose resistant to fluoxetine protein 6-like [Tribolium castaneum]|eukprot:XP_008192686.2 PREDICTED: nose resistant to fluoxetine protein 6-like [Tribolium castaneum]
MWRRVLILFLATPSAWGELSPFVGLLEKVVLSVSPKCLLQLEDMFANFSLNPNSVALQMVDATAKIPSGILSLNINALGDFDQCIKIRAGTMLGKYCLGRLVVQNNTILDKLVADGPVANFFTGNGVVTKIPLWALCLPNGCTSDDANVIGNAFFSTIVKVEGVAVNFTETSCQTINEVYPELSTNAIVTIIILAILVCIVFVTTFYDLYCTFWSKSFCPQLVQGFSIYTNGRKIFKITPPTLDQMPCLNGLRCMSMLWVVYLHHYQILMNDTLTNARHIVEWSDSLSSMFVASASLSVDTFLVISGVLMSYGFIKSKTRNVRFNLISYYLHRYLRLTAPLVVVVFVLKHLYNYLGNGPKMPILCEIFQKPCKKHWWTALLYVQNYVNVSEMCLEETWYLSIDFQLFLISPIIFFALWKYPKGCVATLCGCIIATMGASFYTAWENHLVALVSNFYGNFKDYMHKYYFLTHLRAAPWMIGVILGYYLFKIKQKSTQIKINKIIVCIMWVVCIGVMLACILGGHNTLRSEQYNRWGNSIHIALVRPVWSLAISWIIFACTADYGGPINWILSLPVYQVLNKFTYSMYLVHVVVLSVVIGKRKYPDHFSQLNMWYEYAGTVCFSAVFAIILVFMAEYPTIAIEKCLLESFAQDVKLPKGETEVKMDGKLDDTVSISSIERPILFVS